MSTRLAELRARGAYLLLSLTVLVLDQWSKWLIELHLPPHATEVVVPGLFHLTHVRNTGIAFGLFAAGPGSPASWLLACSALAALVLVTAYFLGTHSRDRLLLTALALVMGGAVGNLLDRLISGAVTDFLDLHLAGHHWPSFNLADGAITAGITLMALDVLRSRRRPPAPEKKRAAEAVTPPELAG